MPALTTPVIRTAITYELGRLTVDFVVNDVTVEIRLLDATGGLVETRTRTWTVAALGLPAAAESAVRAAVLTRLRSDGLIT